MTVSPETEPLLDDGARQDSKSDPDSKGGQWWPAEQACQNGRGRYGTILQDQRVPSAIKFVPAANGKSGGGGGGDDGAGGVWAPRLASSPPVTYTWTSLNVWAKAERPPRSPFRNWLRLRRRPRAPGKHLLKNVSGAAQPGEVLAILGASGAGKTTMLDALTLRSDRELVVTGARAISGAVVTNSRDLAGIAAYVQQKDLFVGWLTVNEHLVFQALLRMDRRIPHRQRMQRVREVMEELSLTKCRDSIIGVPGKVKGISGGEMKRLSFASEVLTDPALILCDEPTSGLDSYMAQTTVEVLRRLARRGKTVILTIHQPSSEVYTMFDKILLLAEGRVAFLGTSGEAATFFTRIGAPCPPKYNPADFYVQLLAVVPNEESACRERIHKVCDAFENSDIAARSAALTDIPVKTFGADGQLGVGFKGRAAYKASWGTQFGALLWRSWLSVRKDPLLVRVRVLQSVMVALLVSVIYFGQELNQTGLTNLNAALFTTLTNITFQNVMAVIKVFCSERAVFHREYMAGVYRIDAYFLARSTAELPIFCVLPVLYAFIIYFAVGFNPDPLRFFTNVGITSLISLVATSFGYLISCAANNISTALTIGAPSVIPLLLYGGFFVNLDTIPDYLSWIQYFSWFRYGNEALLVNQWQDVESISCDDAFSNATCISSGHVALQVYRFSEGSTWKNVGHLAMLVVVFRVIALLLLIFKTRCHK